MPIFDNNSIFQEIASQKSQQEPSNNIFVTEIDIDSIFEEKSKESLSLFEEDPFETEDDECWEEDYYEDEDDMYAKEEDLLSDIFESISDTIESSIFQKSNSSIFETTHPPTPTGIFLVGCTNDKYNKELSSKLIAKDNVVDTLEAIKTILDLIQ